MRVKKEWDLSLIDIYMRFKGKLSYIWDLKSKLSYYIHIKIKLLIYVLLALKSHIWHVLNYIYVDLYFSDEFDTYVVCTAVFGMHVVVPLSVCDHSQGVYFPLTTGGGV